MGSATSKYYQYFGVSSFIDFFFFLQFIAIGAEQRNAIRRALNEDADKLMAEGDPSDPQLRRLKREMDEVNRLFDEFEKRARAEGSFHQFLHPDINDTHFLFFRGK